jgi:hypothetical protein
MSEIAAGTNAIFKILEFTYQLRTADERTADLLNMTVTASNNITHARRLLGQRESAFSSFSLDYMRGAIASAEADVHEVAKLIEHSRVSRTGTGSMSITSRVLWVFRDGEKVQEKYRRLTISHQTLMTVLGIIYGQNPAVAAPDVVAPKAKLDPPPPYDPDINDLFRYRTLRRCRSSATLSPVSTVPSFSGSEGNYSTLVSPATAISSTASSAASPALGSATPSLSFPPPSTHHSLAPDYFSRRAAPSSHLPDGSVPYCPPPVPKTTAVPSELDGVVHGLRVAHEPESNSDSRPVDGLPAPNPWADGKSEVGVGTGGSYRPTERYQLDMGSQNLDEPNTESVERARSRRMRTSWLNRHDAEF